MLLFYAAPRPAVSRLSRNRLVATVVLVFVACIELFFVSVRLGIPNVAFYVWVGIFSLNHRFRAVLVVRQRHLRQRTRRSPVSAIAVGSTAGAPLGAAVAQFLFSGQARPLAR